MKPCIHFPAGCPWCEDEKPKLLTEEDIVNRAEEVARRRRESLPARFWWFCVWMYHEFRVFGWRPSWWK